MAVSRFKAHHILIRFIAALVLVFATYNPSGYSYYHWMVSGKAAISHLIVVGTALVAIYAFLVRSTWRSIRLLGLIIAIGFFASLNYMLVEMNWIDYQLYWGKTISIMISIASILSIGLSFSAIRARLAGQIDSDDVGN